MRPFIVDWDEAPYSVRKAIIDVTINSELLAELSEHEDPLIRACVARNSNVSGETLQKLAQDENEDVRQAAMEHPRYMP